MSAPEEHPGTSNAEGPQKGPQTANTKKQGKSTPQQAPAKPQPQPKESKEDLKKKREEERQRELQSRTNAVNVGKVALQRKSYTSTVAIADLLKEAESGRVSSEKLNVSGWVRSIRSQKKFSFLELTDGLSGTGLQCIIDHPEEIPSYLNGLNTGACVTVEGTLKQSVGAGQLIELVVSGVVVHGLANDKGRDGELYPIAKAKLPLSVLRDHLHLRSRTRVISSVTRLRNACAYNIHTFFQERGFVYVHTPIITGNDCEGAGECFRVTTLLPHSTKGGMKEEDLRPTKDFFQKPSMLTVSGQLHGEAFASSSQKIYTFGPTFRAEDSNTTRHLAEFWMIEPEVWFIDLPNLMNLAEDFIVYCVGKVLSDHIDDVMWLSEYQVQAYNDLSEEEKKITRQQSVPLHQRLMDIVTEPFARISYREALKVLNENLGDIYPECPNKEKLTFGVDLSSELERYLTEKIYNKPVMVHNYPRDIKSFYMKRCDDDTVEAVDVLVPGIGEIIGGSTREHDLERLRSSMKEKNIPEESLQWYMDLRRWGSGPHGGFGLGFERLVLLVTGMSNIRDVIPFPRWSKHCAY